MGLLLGIPLAAVSRWGSWPRVPPSALWRPIGVLLLCMATCAVIAGWLGYDASRSGAVGLMGPLASQVPKAKHHAFIADLWAHLTSYGVGFVGGIVLIAFVGRRRYLAARAAAGGAVAGGGGVGSQACPELLSPRARGALRVAAQLVGLPQLCLLWFAALFLLASLAGNPGRGTVLAVRLTGGVLAAS